MKETSLHDAYKLIHDGMIALARMERQGIRIDMNSVEQSEEELTSEIKDLTKKFKGSKFYKDWKKSRGGSTVNINSDDQLSQYLYGYKKIRSHKTTTSGKGSTDVEALQALEIPELNDLIRIRKLKKIRDTYLGQFKREAVNGFIHPSFNLHIARTYRSSSDSPNFQNIPSRDEEAKKYTKGLLYPREGYQLLEMDFSGLEVAIAACYHKDPKMIQYITDPTTDMHKDMAAQIYMFKDAEFDKSLKPFKILRGGAKNGFVFPQFYGDYYVGNQIALCKWAELPTEGTYKPTQGIELVDGRRIGEHFIEKGVRNTNDFLEHLKKIEYHFWNKRFKVYGAWKKQVWNEYLKTGMFRTHTGFEFRGVFDRKKVTNYPIQGSAFHCLLWSLIQLDRIILKRRMKTRLIGQIHDSLIIDVHPSELEEILATVKKVTEVRLLKKWTWINVPLKIDAELCDVDQSWYTKKEIEF